MADEIIEQFDKKVATIWGLIATGAFKTIEKTVEFVARVGPLDVYAFGHDISVIAGYFLMFLVPTVALIAWKTVGR